jgi:excinuclease ABC subunit B
MDITIKETDRRREVQENYNRINGITPTQISKSITNQLLSNRPVKDEVDDLVKLPNSIGEDPVIQNMGRDDLEKKHQ